MSISPETPVRSPSYPVMSLADAISAVRNIEAHYRSSKVDRVVAAKMIGYSSLSGPANKALAALAQYGLVERAGKGEMRVTARARAILHPDNEGEKRRELRAAALEPSLFQEMQERWPNMIPPEDGVISYFNRRGFNPSAIRPATRAYLQTLLYLEEEGVSENNGGGIHEDADEVAYNGSIDPNLHAQAPAQAQSALPASNRASAPSTVAGHDVTLPLNKINMNIQGDVVHLNATLNYRGLAMLEKKITSLKALMEPDEGEEDWTEDEIDESSD